MNALLPWGSPKRLLSVLGGAVVVGAITVMSFQEIWQNYESQRQLASLRQDIAAATNRESTPFPITLLVGEQASAAKTWGKAIGVCILFTSAIVTLSSGTRPEVGIGGAIILNILLVLNMPVLANLRDPQKQR